MPFVLADLRAATRSRRAVGWSPVFDGPAAWERQMMARIAVGDDAALAQVYDQYASLVHGIAVRLVGATVAPDVSQEVFVSLWKNPQAWDPDRGTLRTFLVVVARRRCIDLLRSSGRRMATEERAKHALLVAVPNVDEAAIAMLAGERVRSALTRLPEAQREAIRLAYFEGLTFTQVAARTGASEGTAKSRIRLGLQRLGTMLGPDAAVTA